jgi:hypothetical protein
MVLERLVGDADYPLPEMFNYLLLDIDEQGMRFNKCMLPHAAQWPEHHKYVQDALDLFKQLDPWSAQMVSATFEGVQTHLAAIAGETYRMDGARLLTLIGLDQGEHPAVISGIVKQQLTDGMRRVVEHAMDVHGGKGICDGPRNYLAQIYRDVPISITVEGANTLTRSLIIFGQGAVRCHPYLLREMLALQQSDERQAVLEFDQALMAHLGYGLRNATATLLHGLTGARLAPAPTDGPERRYYQQLGRFSAAFCVLADLALLTVGGNLKRKERLSGHFADVLSQLYLASGTLKRFADTGQPAEDLALLRWALDDSLASIGRSLEAVCRELPQRWLGIALRWLIFPLGNRLAPPAGITEERAVQTILTPTPTRERLIAIWTRPAAIGAKIMMASEVKIPPRERSPKKIAKLASIPMAPASVAVTVIVSVSRCATWASSCAITPDTSSRVSVLSSPVVAQTAAFFGLRPVANAFGCGVSII